MEIFDYDNILLLPRKCRVESRSECDAGVELGGHKFRLPVVPANMKTVIDEKICIWMAQNHYFYVMHRFDLDNVKFVREMHAKGVYASISLGVKGPDRETVDALHAASLTPEFITIDIAHGHADSQPQDDGNDTCRGDPRRHPEDPLTDVSTTASWSCTSRRPSRSRAPWRGARR